MSGYNRIEIALVFWWSCSTENCT